jgi:twinkle protein
LTDEKEIKESGEIHGSPEIDQSAEVGNSPDVSDIPEKRIKGIFDAEEVADELWRMRLTGLTGGVSTGWNNLDELYTVKRGKWTIITGVPGYGKSTFLDNLLVNLARLHGWKLLYFSFENQPVETHVANLMEIHSGKKFGKHDGSTDPLEKYKMTDAEYLESFNFVNEHFRFADPDESECTVQGIIDIAEEVKASGFNFDGMVTDPYNEIEHRRPAAMTESDYISWVISKFRRFARRENHHWWMVAHPTKLEEVKQSHGTKATMEQKTKIIYKKPTLYSISGSANWRNKADMGIIIHTDETQKSPPTEIDVQKVRRKEEGKKGKTFLLHDFLCERYVQYENELLYRKTENTTPNK